MNAGAAGPWREAPEAVLLRGPAGPRLRLLHGPIDLVIQASGEEAEVAAAYRQARDAFAPVLGRLAAELPRLRRAAGPAAGGPAPEGPALEGLALEGPVARAMQAATAPLAEDRFVTPMAAVAGAVADHVLAALLAGRRLRRAFANNGGDIALWLGPGEAYRVALCADPVTGRMAGAMALAAGPEGLRRGIATSGWRGRSHSLGIADAVTVLAGTAAAADAAATLIANAIDLPGHPAIARVPASALAPDSDLGERLVTTAVGALSAAEVRAALGAGAAEAARLAAGGHILGAALLLAGDCRTVGSCGLEERAETAHA